MYIAFQSNAFQAYAFQTFDISILSQPSGGHKDNWKPPKEKYIGQSYELSKNKWDWQQFEKLQAERKEAETALKAQEYKIRALEEKRLRAMADIAMQKQLVALMREMQLLEAERARLEAVLLFLIREEDEVLAILLSLPF